MKQIKQIEKEIEDFKVETRKFTKWDTGYDIRDFIDSYDAFRYGKLIGIRDVLEELKGGKK